MRTPELRAVSRLSRCKSRRPSRLAAGVASLAIAAVGIAGVGSAADAFRQLGSDTDSSVDSGSVFVTGDVARPETFRVVVETSRPVLLDSTSSFGMPCIRDETGRTRTVTVSLGGMTTPFTIDIPAGLQDADNCAYNLNVEWGYESPQPFDTEVATTASVLVRQRSKAVRGGLGKRIASSISRSIASASGTATEAKALFAKTVVTPAQPVVIRWASTCTQGKKTKRRGGRDSGFSPLLTDIDQFGAKPDECEVEAVARAGDGSRVDLKLYAR